MTYPTSLDVFTNPAAGEFLDDPDHADLHGNANDAIEALEAKVGTGASTATANKVLRGTAAGVTAFGQIDAGDIASNAVETAKIKALNVTTAKIAANNITQAKLAIKLLAGWATYVASGARVSAVVFTVAEDLTDRVGVGDPVEFTDTTTKYGNVGTISYSDPNTTITLATNTDYALVGSPTAIYFGNRPSPVGFPTWFNWTPIMTGFSSNPAGITSEFMINGGSLTIRMSDTGNGTSNSTSKTASIPVDVVATGTTAQVLNIMDNNANAWGKVYYANGSSSFMFYPHITTSTWTASGNCRIFPDGFETTYSIV